MLEGTKPEQELIIKTEKEQCEIRSFPEQKVQYSIRRPG